MAEKELTGIRISRLKPIPKNWTEQQVEELMNTGIVPVVDPGSVNNPETYKVELSTILKKASGSVGVSAFIGKGTDFYVVPEESQSNNSQESDDDKPTPYIYNIESTDSVGDSIYLEEGKIKCKEGWYHVDATYYIENENVSADYAPVWMSIGVNEDFQDYENYDFVNYNSSSNNTEIRHVTSIIHVTNDGDTIDASASCAAPGMTIYLDQISICKIQGASSGGGGSGGSSDIATFSIDMEAILESAAGPGEFLAACRQLWTDMMQAAFENKVVIVSIAKMGTCIAEFNKDAQGVPEEERAEAIQYFKENPEEGTITFFIKSSGIYEEDNVQYNIKVDLNWVEGIQPRYTATLTEDGIIFGVETLEIPVNGRNKEIICYNVTPYKLDLSNGTITSDPFQMFNACNDLLRRGYSAVANVSNEDSSYISGPCSLRAWYYSDNDAQGNLNIIGIYSNSEESQTLGSYRCDSHYTEGESANESWWLVYNEDLISCARGGQIRDITSDDFEYDSSNDLNYVKVFNGESVYVDSIPNGDSYVHFRVCEGTHSQFTTGCENITILVDAPTNMALEVANSRGDLMDMQSGAITSLSSGHFYAIEIKGPYYNCVEVVERQQM